MKYIMVPDRRSKDHALSIRARVQGASTGSGLSEGRRTHIVKYATNLLYRAWTDFKRWFR